MNLETQTRQDTTTTKYVALQHGAAFTRLRSRSRRYLTAMTALFLALFAATIAFAGRLPGSLGLLLAVGLILLPAVLSAVHLRYAARRLDPLAARVRVEYEDSRD